MENILKLTAVCLITVIFSQLLKKNQPEMALILGTCVAIFSVFWIVDLYHGFVMRFKKWEYIMNLTNDYIMPLMKCFAISVISQYSVNLCKDAGQGAVASCLEVCCSMAIIWCIAPLFEQIFAIIEELL